MDFLFKILIFNFLLSGGFEKKIEPIQQTGTITLKMENLRSTKGQILVAIFSSENGFPDQHQKSFKSIAVPVEKVVVLTGIPKGRYALSVVHDEDKNNRMTYKVARLPAEGYWFSKMEPGGIRKRPVFDKFSFDFSETHLELACVLKY